MFNNKKINQFKSYNKNIKVIFIKIGIFDRLK